MSWVLEVQSKDLDLCNNAAVGAKPPASCLPGGFAVVKTGMCFSSGLEAAVQQRRMSPALLQSSIPVYELGVSPANTELGLRRGDAHVAGNGEKRLPHALPSRCRLRK